MRKGYVTAHYDYQKYEDDTVLEIVERRFLVDNATIFTFPRVSSGRFSLSGKRLDPAKDQLTYMCEEDFTKDEMECHFESELLRYLESIKAKSGLYYSLFEFEITWEVGCDTPDGPGETDSYMTLENLKHELISDDKKLIEDFWIRYNLEQERITQYGE